MQHLYNHDAEFYSPTTTTTTTPTMTNHSYPYQHESPPQSSNSDVEENTSTPPASSSSAAQTHQRNGTNKIVKKKKQTKKKRKDPNEPQKPVSPYALFFRDTQNDIKKKLANPSFGEISKVVAHMWENIEPEVKEQYKRKAATAKKEYLKQLAAYRAVQVSQTPSSTAMHHAHPFDGSAHHYAPAPPPPPSAAHPQITDNNNLLSSHHANFSAYHQAAPPATMQNYCPTLSHPQAQFNNYNYLPAYQQDPSTGHYSTPYPSNANQYGLLRPAVDSAELYSANYYSNPVENNLINENLLQNLNHSSIHYTDLSSTSHSHLLMEKHYDYLAPTLNELDHPKDDPTTNSHFHWNPSSCLATQW